MDFTKLGTLNSQQQAKEEVAQSQTKQEIANIETQEVFVKSIQMLAEFLKGHTSRTVVMNQIKDFATSEDINRATQTLDQLHATLKTHENTDVSPVVDVLNKAVSQLEQIPKEQLDLPEYPEQKDYSEQLNKFITVSESIVEAIQAQETVVEAPTVNVDAPVVNVDAPDLKPLSKELDKALSSSFNKAVGKIKIPKPADIKPLVTEQKKTTKSIDKLYKLMHDNPFGGGSSGGGAGSVKAFDANGVLQNVTAVESTDTPGVFGLVVLNADGSSLSTGGGSSPATGNFAGVDGNILDFVDGNDMSFVA